MTTARKARGQYSYRVDDDLPTDRANVTIVRVQGDDYHKAQVTIAADIWHAVREYSDVKILEDTVNALQNMLDDLRAGAVE